MINSNFLRAESLGILICLLICLLLELLCISSITGIKIRVFLRGCTDRIIFLDTDLVSFHITHLHNQQSNYHRYIHFQRWLISLLICMFLRYRPREMEFMQTQLLTTIWRGWSIQLKFQSKAAGVCTTLSQHERESLRESRTSLYREWRFIHKIKWWGTWAP